jgi:hypothetical protein
MNMLWKSIVRNPSFLSGALAGCLIAVLTLAGVSVFAQGSGDVPGGSPAPLDTESGPTSGSQMNDPVGDQPVGPAVQEANAGSPAHAAEADSATMFNGHANAPRAASAAISSAITYQGVLKENGQGANGSFDFRFRLFDAPAAGVQAGQFLAGGVAVQNGQFTTLLDFGPDAFAGQALWLEIAVRPAGGGAYETLTPRQPLTAAPLALSLPNVTTDPASGYVSIGGGVPISDYQFLGINNEIEDWVGMYITGGGPNARPFYGYATDDEGSYEYAWTEYNGGANEWQLHTTGGNVFGVSNTGDVRAAGHVSQPAAANGLVKATAFVECWHEPAFLSVISSFNTITGAPVTAAVGPAQGECYVDFGFDLSGRFYTATAVQAGLARGVTCDMDGGNNNRLRCMRYRFVAAGAEGWGGRIMISIY